MTGTIQNAAGQVITDLKHDALQLGFVNDSGEALTEGQEVILKTDGTIDKRSGGTQKPLGIVIVGSEDGSRATIRTGFTAAVNATAKGGTLNAGTYVKPNGNKNSEGHPEYVACVSGDYSVGQVVKGGAVNTTIKVGILSNPVLLP